MSVRFLSNITSEDFSTSFLGANMMIILTVPITSIQAGAVKEKGRKRGLMTESVN